MVGQGGTQKPLESRERTVMWGTVTRLWGTTRKGRTEAGCSWRIQTQKHGRSTDWSAEGGGSGGAEQDQECYDASSGKGIVLS